MNSKSDFSYSTKIMFIKSLRRCLSLLMLTSMHTFRNRVQALPLVTTRCKLFPTTSPFATLNFPTVSSSELYSKQLSDVDNYTTGDSLQNLTVKELKEKIKQLNVPVKLSKLKLKSDCIDFLTQYYQTKSLENDEIAIEKEAETKIPAARRNRIRTMPRLDSSLGVEPNDDQGVSSPKDIIFEKVLKRYPPLRLLHESLEDENRVNDALSAHMHPSSYRSFTGLGEMDVRQKYHPMLASVTSSDLDLVTVGTASCVPGITRGVSCTALRLQWRRNNVNKMDAKGISTSNNTPSTGGIWIFDCGESTQVRTDEMLLCS